MTDYTQDPDAPPFLQEYEPPPRDSLTPHDLRSLSARWITPELAHTARLRRVDHNEGRQLVGRSGSGDFTGIAIPYYLPGADRPHGWRLRRDKPDMEMKDGRLREIGKYMAAPGSGNMAYFPVGATPEMLADPQLPVAITEGEFKAMALWRLADGKFLPIGLAGVWNWRGTIGKVPGPNGERLNLKGVIPDIERVAWEGRRVIIAFDADAESNESVAAGRRNLAGALRERGALVAVVQWDVSRGKGIDDLLAAEGPAPVLEMFAGARYMGRETTAEGKAEAAHGLIEETERIVSSGDASAVFEKPFVERAALAEKDAYFKSVTKLRDMKNFRVSDFEELVDDEKARLGAARLPADHGPDTTTDPLRHMLNDHGNACRIRDMYGEDLRYCFDMKCWLVWDGMRWAVGDIGQARQLAKQAMLEFLRSAVLMRNEPCEKFSRNSLNARSVNNMLAMLESDLPVRAKELDTNPWLLNFINGTVDLRTGKLQDHDRNDFITKLVHYTYDQAAACPLWQEFLERVMGGGPEASAAAVESALGMTAYLQRALGYSVTGSTSEKAVFIPFGSGNNGKSTMLTVVRELVKEYSTLLQVDTLMTRQENNNSQSDLADLRGARFVQTSETEEGQRLSQGKLKRITQGMGSIRAARKWENMIEFPETHKLWMDTNRRPDIRDAEDKATFNRLHPIPFTVEIPPDKIDKEFPAKLSKEAQGILTWLVQGSSLWHRCQSLGRPADIDQAREAWQQKSDQISHFIEEMIKVEDPINTSVKTKSAIIYEAYSRWCERAGERTKFPQSKFIEKMGGHGYTPKHQEDGNYLLGARLLTAPPPVDPDPPFDDGTGRYR